MESKLYEECHEGGGFMAQQAMLKQDETVRTQIFYHKLLLSVCVRSSLLIQPLLLSLLDSKHRVSELRIEIRRHI